MALIRSGEPRDLPEIAAIQQSSPEAAQWNVDEYLQYDFRVAESEGSIAGFLVSRKLAEGEREILNLAVRPDFRRRGVAGALWAHLMTEGPGAFYLEVRESNQAARMFYKSMGFQEIGRRPGYYETLYGSTETAIVMKFHSC